MTKGPDGSVRSPAAAAALAAAVSTFSAAWMYTPCTAAGRDSVPPCSSASMTAECTVGGMTAQYSPTIHAAAYSTWPAPSAPAPDSAAAAPESAPAPPAASSVAPAPANAAPDEGVRAAAARPESASMGSSVCTA